MFNFFIELLLYIHTENTWLYLQRIVLGDSFHHVGHSSLKNLFKSEGIHHCKDARKVLQDFFLLFHAYSLAVGHSDVCLLVIGNLHLIRRQTETWYEL